ncbi:MAG TPA: hypothetical protein GX745_03065 [Clostridiales bacterium]|jgi:nucleoside 2-deoxyribosyltransferase|nr:hypothetical protein [Clostridiales bacterium]
MDFCPMCHNEVAIEDSSYSGHKRTNCPVCGEYYFAQHFFDNAKITVCAYIYNAIKNNDIIPIFTDQVKLSEPIDSNMALVTPDILLGYFPKNLSELIDQTVLNIAFYIKTIGAKINYIYLTNISDRQYARKSALLKTLFCVYDNNLDQVSILLKHLEKLGYIEPLARGVFSLTLSFQGWMRVEKLQNNTRALNQAYLIASSKDSMKECRNKMKKAMTDLGFLAKFSDETFYAKPVTREIFYELRRSKIVIADLTYYKPHVYYETGYAEALKKPVIYTCKNGYYVKRQFDIIHNNTIKWETTNQLYKALINRVSATLSL